MANETQAEKEELFWRGYHACKAKPLPLPQLKAYKPKQFIPYKFKEHA